MAKKWKSFCIETVSVEMPNDDTRRISDWIPGCWFTSLRMWLVSAVWLMGDYSNDNGRLAKQAIPYAQLGILVIVPWSLQLLVKTYILYYYIPQLLVKTYILYYYIP